MHRMAICGGSEQFITRGVNNGSKFLIVLWVWFLSGTRLWQQVVQDQQPGLLQLGQFQINNQLF
jgi:hypothetical protein